jgi:hypothetical protein
VPSSALQRSLAALTASLVDSVMEAIRSASLEELLGREKATRVRATRRARVSKPRPVAAPRPKMPASPTVAAEIVPHTPELAPASEITDPESVLGYGQPVDSIPEEPPSPPQVEERPSGYQVRLRENETLARVSNAGAIIRRARSR